MDYRNPRLVSSQSECYHELTENWKRLIYVTNISRSSEDNLSFFVWYSALPVITRSAMIRRVKPHLWIWWKLYFPLIISKLLLGHDIMERKNPPPPTDHLCFGQLHHSSSHISHKMIFSKKQKSVRHWTLVCVSSVCERTKVTNEQLEGGQRGGERKCTRATSKDTKA